MTLFRLPLAHRLAVAAVLAGAVTSSLVLTGGRASAAPSGKDGLNTQHYSVGLFGDLPYGPAGREEYPALTADVNSARLAFSVFDGDVKNGSETCDDQLYADTTARFAAFTDPVVYTPGDNEWTDCDRPSAGPYDPEERLSLIRRTFFTSDQSLGRRTMAVERQAAPYVENARWAYGPVTYATLHVTGSNNNNAKTAAEAPLPDGVAKAQAEYRARNAANVRWLDATFAAAKAQGSKAVLVALQADMDLEGAFAPATTDGFADTKAALLRGTLAFPGQVVLVNGDSHYLKVDKPLLDSRKQMVENFTRVQTFGDAETHWVEAEVDAKDPNVFTFRPRIVAANVEDHSGG